MLTDPHFVEPEGVEMLNELEVALQGQRRVGARGVERRNEVSEPELGHAASCNRDTSDDNESDVLSCRSGSKRPSAG
jgi:hypothetical protein